MRFQLSEDQQAIGDLAGTILGDLVTNERLRAMERSGEQMATDAWAELAAADLVGIALPEQVGGGGYDILGAALVLEQVGRHVAPVPYLATVVLGAMPIAQFGTPAQHEHIRAVIAGELLVTAALLEGTGALPPAVPRTEATAERDGWVLHGQKAFVPWGTRADLLLVPARLSRSGGPADASTVFLVRADSPGVSIEALQSTSGEPLAVLHLDGVHVGVDDVLGEQGGAAEILAWLLPRAIAAVCATAAGVCEGALALLATYTSERKQFDVPIATFQAVAHRAADAYIDTQAVQATARQAAWRLSEDLDADEAVAIAKFWAAEGGQRVVHAAQHLHGGIGVDLDYPLHRYFRAAKMCELTFGGAHEHLERLGARLAHAHAPA